MSADRERVPFIPAWLDDSHLTATQFRVFCHIARRGNCWESLPTMAECCRMRRPTVQTALGELAKMNVITKEKRTGQTSIYRLTPSPKQALTTQTERGTTPQPKRGTRDLAQKRHYKGSPTKVSPNKECPKFHKSREIEL
jgi:hypothetical protein